MLLKPLRCLSKRKDTNFKANHNIKQMYFDQIVMFV